VGKLFWILLHAGLGFAFASQWQLVNEQLGAAGRWAGMGIAVIIAGVLLARRLTRGRKLVQPVPPV
jgi:Na+-driven multidrug efflux pump